MDCTEFVDLLYAMRSGFTCKSTCKLGGYITDLVMFIDHCVYCPLCIFRVNQEFSNSKPWLIVKQLQAAQLPQEEIFAHWKNLTVGRTAALPCCHTWC